MKSQVLDLRTSGSHFTDVTTSIRTFCREEGDGLCHAFAPHATAGLAVFELGAGSDEDLDEVLNRLLPRDDRWTHRHGSPGHGADHVLPAFISPSLSIPVIAGKPALGTWQSIVFVDLNDDNPVRHLRLSFISG